MSGSERTRLHRCTILSPFISNSLSVNVLCEGGYTVKAPAHERIVDGRLAVANQNRK